MNNIAYVGGKKASEILGVHQRTLYVWENNKKIDTIRTDGDHRLYNVTKNIEERTNNNIIVENIEKIEQLNNNKDQIKELNKLDHIKNKLNICYVRVSSASQKDDLERQKKYMVEKYPNYILIEDIGSGLNLNKRGIKKIIDLGIQGKINELVVAYKDRLTRFGFEMIEDIITKYSNGKIIILNKKEKKEPEEELVTDVLAILNVYVAKMNGLRKYKKNKKEIKKNYEYKEDNCIKKII